LYCYVGADPTACRSIRRVYPKLDPTADSPCFGVEQVVSATDLVPYEEFRRGRFYREWARPHGWVDVASAVIEKSATSCTFLSVVRHEAKRPGRRRNAPAHGAPDTHVRRALLIGQTIHRKQTEAVCFSDVLDGLKCRHDPCRRQRPDRPHQQRWSCHSRTPATSCARSAAGSLPAIWRSTLPCARSLVAANAGDAALGVKGIAPAFDRA